MSDSEFLICRCFPPIIIANRILMYERQVLLIKLLRKEIEMIKGFYYHPEDWAGVMSLIRSSSFSELIRIFRG